MAEKYELAEKDYIKGMKYKDIAEKHDVSINTVKSWKVRHKWERNGVHTKEKGVHTKKKKDAKVTESSKKAIERIVDSEELTEKQRMFCVYYVKSFNATQSMIKAGYAPASAHVEGHRLLKNPKIANEIRRIKGDMAGEVYLSAKDVLDKYIKIAFSDMTDYLSFGRKEVLTGYTEDGEEELTEVNYLEFKDSSEIDGTLISEVKQGKDGVSIKLEDKMKALEKLSQYFDLFPDKFKRDIESEKLKIAQAKMSGGDDTQEKDVASALRGLVDAVNAQTD
jgi:phage terminase small subunit